MSDVFATTILQYSLIIGVGTAVIASASLLVTSLRKQITDKQIIGRLSRLEAGVRNDAQTLDSQVTQASYTLVPNRARDVMADLSVIANDLERRTVEMQTIINELRSANARNETIEATKKIASLGIGVGATEARVKSLLQRIEREQQAISAGQVNTVGQN